MRKDNPYLEQVQRLLPRLLALYDTNPISPTYGVGDRYRWAWKLIDFSNGTFQSAAHGLARLLSSDLLPASFPRASILGRIDAMFRGTEFLRRKNGSMEEAFPYESSFCVTALVAYDLLSAVTLLEKVIDAEKRTHYLDIVRPMIKFLHRADETHAFISNHLATAVAALYKWTKLTGEAGEVRGREILDRILEEQSEEGWFREYEGADPGYQSLCTYYLADVHLLRPDIGLLEPLRRSIQFLWHFAHPDGSFGGQYGSRNARFYFPAGIEALSSEIIEAAALADFMYHSISNRTVVTLEVMDEPNLIPMFNSYCLAAALFERRDTLSHERLPILPASSKTSWRRQFSHAGMIIDKGEKHYTIVSWHKGGVCCHFSLNGKNPLINVGVVAQSTSGRYYSSQAYQLHNDIQVNGDTITITAPLVEMNKRLPTPLQFIILRLLSITIMRSLTIGNWIKKVLVRFLITGKKVAPVINRRTIKLGPDIAIEDVWKGKDQEFSRLNVEEPFSAIHMASQGYWQKQDELV